MLNFLLGLRYKVLKDSLNKVDYTKGKVLQFQTEGADLQKLSNFNVKNAEFYNEHPVYFKSSAVHMVTEGIALDCYREEKIWSTWQGKRLCQWTAGMIDTRGKYACSNGTWEIEAKICNSWPAIWLLKLDRTEPGYDRQQITPEVDIMEVINNKVEHNVHWGYDNVEYVRFHEHQRLDNCDGQFHKFAVELLDDGYNFYVDGILTARFRSSNPQFVTNAPNYLIINNAAGENTNHNTSFIIKSIKVWK